MLLVFQASLHLCVGNHLGPLSPHSQALCNGGSRLWADLRDHAGGRRIHWSTIISQKVHHPLPAVQRAALETGTLSSLAGPPVQWDCLAFNGVWANVGETSHRESVFCKKSKSSHHFYSKICVHFLSLALKQKLIWSPDFFFFFHSLASLGCFHWVSPPFRPLLLEPSLQPWAHSAPWNLTQVYFFKTSSVSGALGVSVG